MSSSEIAGAQPKTGGKWGLWVLSVVVVAVVAAVGFWYLSDARQLAQPADDAGRWQKVRAMYAVYAKEFPGLPDVSATGALQAASKGGVVFLDVRDDHERRVSIIPGALSPAQFQARKADLKAKRVIVYCTIGYRSGVAAEKLRKEGIDAVNLAGGILAWLHSGGKLVTPEGQPTERVHVYGSDWDLAPVSCKAVY